MSSDKKPDKWCVYVAGKHSWEDAIKDEVYKENAKFAAYLLAHKDEDEFDGFVDDIRIYNAHVGYSGSYHFFQRNTSSGTIRVLCLFKNVASFGDKDVIELIDSIVSGDEINGGGRTHGIAKRVSERLFYISPSIHAQKEYNECKKILDSESIHDKLVTGKKYTDAQPYGVVNGIKNMEEVRQVNPPSEMPQEAETAAYQHPPSSHQLNLDARNRASMRGYRVKQNGFAPKGGPEPKPVNAPYPPPRRSSRPPAPKKFFDELGTNAAKKNDEVEDDDNNNNSNSSSSSSTNNSSTDPSDLVFTDADGIDDLTVWKTLTGLAWVNSHRDQLRNYLQAWTKKHHGLISFIVLDHGDNRWGIAGTDRNCAVLHFFEYPHGIGLGRYEQRSAVNLYYDYNDHTRCDMIDINQMGGQSIIRAIITGALGLPIGHQDNNNSSSSSSYSPTFNPSPIFR